MGLRNDVFLSMAPPLENKLIGNILKEYFQMSKIMQRHFGGALQAILEHFNG
jgi:hypothetical protein